MKALTICQPYPHLILLPRSDPRHKRIENRTWPLRHRGKLVIHAGKSRQWLDADTLDEYGIREDDMAFGAIVGVATVTDCVPIEAVRRFASHGLGMRTGLRWLCTHPHASGPWCIVLDHVRRLQTPIPYRGAQGLFDVPDDLIAAAELVAVDA